MGMHMLLNFGVMNGTQEGWSTGSNEVSTNTNNRTQTDVFGRQNSTSQTTGITDNLTVEFKDKSIENLLEKIDRHIKRMKIGSSYGVWEVACYFISKEKKLPQLLLVLIVHFYSEKKQVLKKQILHCLTVRTKKQLLLKNPYHIVNIQYF